MSAITVAATSQEIKMSDCRGYESRLLGSSMRGSREKQGQWNPGSTRSKSLCIGNKASQLLWRRNIGRTSLGAIRAANIHRHIHSKTGASQTTI